MKEGKDMKARQSQTKNVLLHTYLTSLLSLVLCVSMFLGTSYAWFTSEVSNSGNEIYIGTLKADLQDASGNSLVDSDEKLFDGSICWEPGYTALETVKIVNKGDLAFRYALTFSDGKLDGSTDAAALRTVAENFLVYVHPGEYAQGEAAPKSFAEIENSEHWTPVRLGKDSATLADILEKSLPVLSGNMENVAEEDTYIIALHMNEDATGEELMGQRIGLNVKLTAYQRTHEQDAFGADYDLQAHVTELGALDIEHAAGKTEPSQPMHLHTAYQFQPVETYEEIQNAPYRKYVADFVVWADKDVPGNSMALAGYYEAFCSLMNGDRWIALSTPDTIPANTPIRLVDSMGADFAVTYELLCEYGNDGIGFLCGAADLTGENAGTTITVELRLHEVKNDGNGHNVETGAYTVVGRYEYTFQ